MEKKVRPIASKAQSRHFYEQYKQGKISYESLMKSVHATKDIRNLPERVTPKKGDKLAIEGLL